MEQVFRPAAGLPPFGLHAVPQSAYNLPRPLTLTGTTLPTVFWTLSDLVVLFFLEPDGEEPSSLSSSPVSTPRSSVQAVHDPSCPPLVEPVLYFFDMRLKKWRIRAPPESFPSLPSSFVLLTFALECGLYVLPIPPPGFPLSSLLRSRELHLGWMDLWCLGLDLADDESWVSCPTQLGFSKDWDRILGWYTYETQPLPSSRSSSQSQRSGSRRSSRRNSSSMLESFAQSSAPSNSSSVFCVVVGWKRSVILHDDTYDEGEYADSPRSTGKLCAARMEIPRREKMSGAFGTWTEVCSILLPGRCDAVMRSGKVEGEFIRTGADSFTLAVVEDVSHELLILDIRWNDSRSSGPLRWYIAGAGDLEENGFFPPRPGFDSSPSSPSFAPTRSVSEESRTLCCLGPVVQRHGFSKKATILLDEKLRLWQVAWRDSLKVGGESGYDDEDDDLDIDGFPTPGFFSIDQIGRIESQVLIEDSRALLLSLIETSSEISSVWTLTTGGSRAGGGRIGTRSSASFGSTSVTGGAYFAFGEKTFSRNATTIIPLVDYERNRIRFVEFNSVTAPPLTSGQKKRGIEDRRASESKRPEGRRVRFAVPEDEIEEMEEEGEEKETFPILNEAVLPIEVYDKSPERLARDVVNWAHSNFGASFDLEEDILPLCRTSDSRRLLVHLMEHLHPEEVALHVRKNVRIRKAEVSTSSQRRTEVVNDEVSSKREQVSATMREVEDLNRLIAARRRKLVSGDTNLLSRVGSARRRDDSMKGLLSLLDRCEKNVPELIDLVKELAKLVKWMNKRSEDAYSLQESVDVSVERTLLSRKREISPMLKVHLANKQPVSLVSSLRGEVEILAEELEREYFVAESTIPKPVSSSRIIQEDSESAASIANWIKKRRALHLELFSKIENGLEKVRSLEQELVFLNREAARKLEEASHASSRTRFRQVGPEDTMIQRGLLAQMKREQISCGLTRAHAMIREELKEISEVHLGPTELLESSEDNRVREAEENLSISRTKARGSRSRVEGVVADIVELRRRIDIFHNRAVVVGSRSVEMLRQKTGMLLDMLRRRVEVHVN